MEEKRKEDIREQRADHSIGYVYGKFMEFRPRRVSTQKLYNYAYGLFTDFVGTDSMLICEINDNVILNFIKWLDERYSGNSGYVVFCIIKSVFNFAERQYYIRINPFNLVNSRAALTDSITTRH